MTREKRIAERMKSFNIPLATAAEKRRWAEEDIDREDWRKEQVQRLRSEEPGERELQGYVRRAAKMGSDFLDHDHSMDH